MKYSILLLLLVSSLANARPWQESFDEAVENKSKSDCESTYERMYDQCSVAGIYRGGQTPGAPEYCRSMAKKMRNGCISRIDDAITEANEEKASARAEQEARNASAADFRAATSIINAGPPALELACTLTETTNPTSFNKNVEMKIYNGGACEGGFGRQMCNITTAQFSGSSRSRSWTLNRSTGEMSVISENNSDVTATYRCQKASAATNKF